LLKEALSKVIAPDCTVQHVLELAKGICLSMNGESACEVCENREVPDRIFYRGIIDFELVENARAGMSRLVTDLVERFGEKKVEMTADVVEAALARIEEGVPVESEELLWQVTGGEEMNEIFEQVQAVIEEMETEKRFRRAVHYDEWDVKLDDYRKDWCRVREIDMPETNTRFYSQTIEDNYGLVSLLRRYFGLLRPDRIKRFFREERGDDIDFDALIESVVDRHAGITPSDRVYIRREKNLRDVSVAFLVDMSYSTGDELPSGKRIVDIEREGLVLMAEALESIGDQWAVYGFSSNYRDKVDFFVVRDFGERFSRQVKMRFEGIKPIAQTRLGAAIRHASSLLARQASRIRLLILMSDGRPYDIDYGDADYAVEDTRRALWEGRRKGVSSFCITVDKKSRDYLPYMFGEANYTLIDNIETMPARLPLIYKRLTA
jgi:nitric oxide reductase activation protein